MGKVFPIYSLKSYKKNFTLYIYVFYIKKLFFVDYTLMQ